jgi:serine protease Do
MRKSFSRTVAAVLAVAVLGGAGTEARAQFDRRNPFTLAVKKTRDSIVTIKVEKRGNWGRKDVVGTGVIVDGRGYVVTNRHVVAGAERVTVVLADGGEVQAQVLVEDSHHDLAILRLPSGRTYKELAFGPGSDLMVGETVLAIGHPFGYTNTVSTGIISALGREIKMPSGETLKDLIQTNASINPGNSGGPLLNINGELIGINVALREGAQGIAFALNADMVQQFLSRHLSAGKVAHLGHGLSCREKVVSEHGPARQLVVVEHVAEKSPAAAGGLRPGDVLVKLARRAVANRFDVERALWDYKAGDKVEATVVRAGKETRVTLTLARGGAPAGVASAQGAGNREKRDADKAQPAKGQR